MTDEIQTDYSDTYVIHHPNAVPAGRGAGWLIDGFGYFKQAPAQWLAVCIVGFLIMIGISFIPVLNLFAGVLTPVWSAGLMLGCKDLHEGKALQVRHLFAGFGDKIGPLMLSGVLVSGLSIAVALIIFGPLFIQLISGNSEAVVIPDNRLGLVLRVLLMLVLMIPIYAAAWFSPALIALGNTDVIEALKLSLRAGLRNIVPFLVYMLMGIILVIPVVLTVGLGMLIVGPMFIASAFIAFREIFVEE